MTKNLSVKFRFFASLSKESESEDILLKGVGQNDKGRFC